MCWKPGAYVRLEALSVKEPIDSNQDTCAGTFTIERAQAGSGGRCGKRGDTQYVIGGYRVHRALWTNLMHSRIPGRETDRGRGASCGDFGGYRPAGGATIDPMGRAGYDPEQRAECTCRKRDDLPGPSS